MAKDAEQDLPAIGDKMAADFAAHLETLPTQEVEQYLAEAREKIKRAEKVEVYKAMAFQSASELMKRRGYRPPWSEAPVKDILAFVEGRTDHQWSGDWAPIQ